MNMKTLGIALLAVCMVAVTLVNTVTLGSASAHPLFALTPATEPPTNTSVPSPQPSVPPQPSATTPPDQTSTSQPPPETSVPPSSPQPTNTPSRGTPRDKADLVISKQASTDVAVVGQVIDFTITVTNKGNGPAGNVVMNDDLPSFLELVNVTPSRGVVAVTGSMVEVTFGEVAAGEVITIVISARVVAVATPPNNENIATVTSSSTSDNKDNNSARTNVQVVPATPVPTASPLPPTVVPLATPVPPPAKLPPTGADGGTSPVWPLTIGLLAILLGLGLRRARQ